MEEEIVVPGIEGTQETGNQPEVVEQNTQTPNPRETFFARVKEEFGIEPKDEEDIVTYTKGIQGELQKYKDDYVKIESEVKKMPPVFREVAAMLEAQGFQGTDEELMAKTIAYLGENSTNYADVARNNPDQLLRRHLKETNPAYTDQQLDQVIARKTRTYAHEAAEEGLDGDEAANYIREQLALEATAFVPYFEGKKASLKFKPDGLPEPKTEAQIQAEAAEVRRQYNMSTINAAKSFKGIDLGEAGVWEESFFDDKGNIVEEHLPLLNEIASGEWLRQFINQDGTPNHAAMLEYAAYRKFSPVAASKRAQDAHGQGANDLLKTVRNSSIGNPPSSPSGKDQQATLLDGLKAFHGK